MFQSNCRVGLETGEAEVLIRKSFFIKKKQAKFEKYNNIFWKKNPTKYCYSVIHSLRMWVLWQHPLILASFYIPSLSRYNWPKATPYLERKGHSCIYIDMDSMKTRRWWGSISFWFLSPFTLTPENFTFLVFLICFKQAKFKVIC